MVEFTLDTSGDVRLLTGDAGGEREFTRYRWHNLSPFVQGYIEAAFASLERDQHGRPFLRRGGHGAWNLGFADLAPETLAQMIADCEAHGEKFFTPSWSKAVQRNDGRQFWLSRQRGSLASDGFPPLTLYLADDGKVLLREKE